MITRRVDLAMSVSPTVRMNVEISKTITARMLGLRKNLSPTFLYITLHTFVFNIFIWQKLFKSDYSLRSYIQTIVWQLQYSARGMEIYSCNTSVVYEILLTRHIAWNLRTSARIIFSWKYKSDLTFKSVKGPKAKSLKLKVQGGIGHSCWDFRPD